MVDHIWLHTTSKRLIAPPQEWAERANPDELFWASPIEINGVAVEGFRFRMTAMRSMPEEAVTCQLEYHERRKIGGPLCRVDWKPMHAHDNKAHGPPDLRHKRFAVSHSHHHEFNVNWSYAASMVRKGNLPIAVDLSPEPPNFSEFLAFLEKELRIEGLGVVPRPPWQATLF
jgi:hypothetical protein